MRPGRIFLQTSRENAGTQTETIKWAISDWHMGECDHLNSPLRDETSEEESSVYLAKHWIATSNIKKCSTFSIRSKINCGLEHLTATLLHISLACFSRHIHISKCLVG